MNRSRENEEPVLPPISSHFESVDDTSVELKKEMTEMKKMLKDMQQSATHSRFPDEMKPLLTHLEKQGLSAKFHHTNWVKNLYNRMKAEKKDFTNEEQLANCESNFLNRNW